MRRDMPSTSLDRELPKELSEISSYYYYCIVVVYVIIVPIIIVITRTGRKPSF